jgi:hypothetical protein
MTGDCHVRFCERRGVRFPPATRLAPARWWELQPTSQRLTARSLTGAEGEEPFEHSYIPSRRNRADRPLKVATARSRAQRYADGLG